MKNYFYGLFSTLSGLITGAFIVRCIDIDRQKKHLRVYNGKPLKKKGGCNKCLK